MRSAVLSLLPMASAEVMFKETFEDMSAWTQSKWKGESEMGEFELKAAQNNPDSDMSMATGVDARFYGASAHFKKPFSNKGKTLVVQYEVTSDKDVECGGGYLKMGEKMEDATKFGDPTKYSLMFGPDKCGHTKRTHLIFNYKGKNVLKKTDLPYKQSEEAFSTLYRLILTPENKATVEIDGEQVYTGSLESDWDMLDPKEIDDSEDKKPSDWVDDAMMDDPEEKKPADWVEAKEIVDKDAKQPEDWDAEEDGEWEAPMIANPDFKGEWSAKRISNPAYKGVWAPKKITNPKYEADTELYLMAKTDLAFIGFDLWQVKAGTLFDNVLVAADKDEKVVLKEADELKDAWTKRKEEQKKKKESTTTTTTTTEASTSTEEEVDNDDDKKDDDDKIDDDKKDEEDL